HVRLYVRMIDGCSEDGCGAALKRCQRFDRLQFGVECPGEMQIDRAAERRFFFEFLESEALGEGGHGARKARIELGAQFHAKPICLVGVVELESERSICQRGLESGVMSGCARINFTHE